MGRRTGRSSLRGKILVQLAVCFAAVPLGYSQTNIQSKDAYVRRDGSDWVLGTSLVEKRVRWADGQLSSISLSNKKSGVDHRSAAGEIQFMANGQRSGKDSGWQFLNEHSTAGSQGELQLDISLSLPALRATKHYVIYPGTPVIREWLTLENSSAQAVHISQVGFLNMQFPDSGELEFNYVTGGGNFNGSQLLKTEPIGSAFQRTIDSNGGAQPTSYSGYLPLIFLLGKQKNDGLAVGWDYLGHWCFQIGNEGGKIGLLLELAGFEKDLPPGGQIETPRAFTAAFSGGVDDLGNQLLDWQYAYLWDFTNSNYFAKTRWAVDWPDPWVGDGGTPSADNWGRRLALDLCYVDLLRETGTDILWDDAGWYDKWGTWNGPDWRATNEYVRKHGMRWVLWYPTFLATPNRKWFRNILTG